MNNSSNVVFWTSIIFSMTGVLVTATEYPFIQEGLPIFLGSRALALILTFLSSWLLRKNPTSFINNSIMMLAFTIYTCVGYMYRPMYLVGYTQIIFFFSFLYSTTRKEFLVLSTIFYISFVTTSFLNFEHLPYNRGDETLIDLFITPFTSNIIGMVVHHFFTAERTIKEALYDRFNSLGRMTATIVHDLKGSLGTPLMILGPLEDAVNNSEAQDANKHVSDLKMSLNAITRMVSQLNKLSNVTEMSQKESHFKISDCVEDAKILLSKRLNHVSLKFDGEKEITGNKEVMSSIVMNILINALDEFRNHGVTGPEIKIEATKTTVTFLDNGPGFKTDELKRIKAGEILSSKESGSGLGLYLVKDSLKAFGARLEISNATSGGVVKITFKK